MCRQLLAHLVALGRIFEVLCQSGSKSYRDSSHPSKIPDIEDMDVNRMDSEAQQAPLFWKLQAGLYCMPGMLSFWVQL